MPAKAPLRAAVERNNLSKATTLLRAGNLQSEENSDDEAASLLVAAMARGHLSMVGVLLDAGATSRPGEGAALLVGAIKADTKEGLALVAPLLRVVDADAVNGHVREWTPLMHAAKVGHVPTAEALLAAGAKVDAAMPTTGGTALMIAVQYAQEGAVAALLAAGAPTEAVDSQGWTALKWAAQVGETKMIGALLAGGASVAPAAAGAGTALSVAVENSRVEAVETLLAAGAKNHLDAVDEQGWTAVGTAAAAGHGRIV